MCPRRGAFTLVEILIVVIILGILAAIIIPSFSTASSDAQMTATYYELHKIRRAVGAYRAIEGVWPPIEENDNPEIAWGGLVRRSDIPDGDQEMDFLQAPPINAWVGGANSRVVRVVAGAVPDAVYHTDYGWLFDPQNGDVWAASFDEKDQPHPRP